MFSFLVIVTLYFILLNSFFFFFVVPLTFHFYPLSACMMINSFLLLFLFNVVIRLHTSFSFFALVCVSSCFLLLACFFFLLLRDLLYNFKRKKSKIEIHDESKIRFFQDRLCI
jgi:hypothetical protein